MNSSARRTVLIVEDEWLVRMELAAVFEDEGFAVVESASAEEALASLNAPAFRDREARIDLLVTDIRLGGSLSGWDLAEAARTIDGGIAVIYVSANPPAPGRHVSGSLFFDKPAAMARIVEAACDMLG